MSGTIKILHLEDNQGDAELVKALLESHGIACAMRRVQSKVEFEAALAQEPFDLIISDYTLPSFDGMSALMLAHSAASAGSLEMADSTASWASS